MVSNFTVLSMEKIDERDELKIRQDHTTIDITR